MKKRKLPKTIGACWKLTLAMWKDIATVASLMEVTDMSIVDLKVKWLEQKGFDPDQICYSCFFCQWSREHGYSIEPNIPGGCSGCPAVKIDRCFSCQLPNLYWAHSPVEMYQRFVALNKKRLAKRRGKK